LAALTLAASVTLLVACNDAQASSVVTMELPDSEAAAVSTLSFLPDDFRGDPRDTRLFPTSVSYRDQEVGIKVIDVGAGDFWPAGSTVGDVLDIFAGGHDWEVLETGSEGDRSWIRIKTEGSDSPDSDPRVRQSAGTTSGSVGGNVGQPSFDVYGLNVGDRSAHWLVVFTARSADELDELVSLFVEAAATMP